MSKLLLIRGIVERILIAGATDPTERESILAEVTEVITHIEKDLEFLAKLGKSKTGKTLLDYFKHHGNLPGTPESRAAAEAASDGE